MYIQLGKRGKIIWRNRYIEDIQVFGVNMTFILYFTVKPNVYQNLIKLVFSLI